MCVAQYSPPTTGNEGLLVVGDFHPRSGYPRGADGRRDRSDDEFEPFIPYLTRQFWTCSRFLELGLRRDEPSSETRRQSALMPIVFTSRFIFRSRKSRLRPQGSALSLE